MSVTDEQLHLTSAPGKMPEKIYVVDFTFVDTDLNVDRKGEVLKKFKQDLQSTMSDALTERLSKNIAPAIRVKSIWDVPEGNHWVLTGNFTRVNQGSRALRTTVGFGAGGTKMEAEIRILDRNQSRLQPFLTFNTTGGSNAEPGALSGLGPGTPVMTAASVAVSGASVIFHGITEDTIRTSRMITATLSDYLYQQGWITDKERMIPKRQTENDTEKQNS